MGRDGTDRRILEPTQTELQTHVLMRRRVTWATWRKVAGRRSCVQPCGELSLMASRFWSRYPSHPFQTVLLGLGGRTSKASLPEEGLSSCPNGRRLRTVVKTICSANATKTRPPEQIHQLHRGWGEARNSKRVTAELAAVTGNRQQAHVSPAELP